MKPYTKVCVKAARKGSAFMAVSYVTKHPALPVQLHRTFSRGRRAAPRRKLPGGPFLAEAENMGIDTHLFALSLNHFTRIRMSSKKKQLL